MMQFLLLTCNYLSFVKGEYWVLPFLSIDEEFKFFIVKKCRSYSTKVYGMKRFASTMDFKFIQYSKKMLYFILMQNNKN